MDNALDVFNTALPDGNKLNVADSYIGYTTPSGLYGQLNAMKQNGISGVSTTRTDAPDSSPNCN